MSITINYNPDNTNVAKFDVATIINVSTTLLNMHLCKKNILPLQQN